MRSFEKVLVGFAANGGSALKCADMKEEHPIALIAARQIPRLDHDGGQKPGSLWSTVT